MRLTYSPDGKKILVAYGHVLDAASGKQLRRMPRSDDFALSRDGKLMAVGGSRLQLFDFASGELRRECKADARDNYLNVCFAPDGKLLASSSYRSKTIHLWNPATGRELRRWPYTRLVNRCLGLANLQSFWGWRNCTSAQAVGLLDAALALRHEIAHGVNPRPVIHNAYSKWLPGFVRRLARRTDEAIRNHVTTTLGFVNPWPP